MNDAVPSIRTGVYEAVTQQIIAALETGVGRYKTPWHCAGPALSLPTNATTHSQYRGVNIVMLWMAAMQRGYDSGLWASYRQWRSLDAQVRKDERGVMIIFYKEMTAEAAEDAAGDRNRRRFVARASYVFNSAQVDGFAPAPVETVPLVTSLATVDAFIAASGATIRHGCRMACYDRRLDLIEMPLEERFVGSDTSSATEAYYATILHELTHWTGAERRLNRDLGKRFGDQAYAMEELVAELGAAFLCTEFGIASEPRPDHAAYIANWLTVLKKDTKAIFAAASKAQEAFDYLRDLVIGEPVAGTGRVRASHID